MQIMRNWSLAFNGWVHVTNKGLSDKHKLAKYTMTLRTMPQVILHV